MRNHLWNTLSRHFQEEERSQEKPKANDLTEATEFEI